MVYGSAIRIMGPTPSGLGKLVETLGLPIPF